MVNKELDALVSLLDEPDVAIFKQVRDKLFSYGPDAIPALEDAWDVFHDDGVQRRIETIIHHIQFEYVFKAMKDWKNSKEQDLLTGYILVAKCHYPNLDENTIISQIGKIIQDVWLELNNKLTPLEKIKVVNHIIYDVHGFKSNAMDMHAYQNSFINTVFETKKANPISLSIIYMVVCQSLKIPVYGVNVPQNFIVAYMGGMISDLKLISKDDVQFYLNPFNKGAVFTHREVELFLSQIKVEHDDKYFVPCDNVTIINRVLNNLIFAFEKSGEPDKSKAFKRLKTALE